MGDSFSTLIEILREEGKFYNEPSFYIAKVINPLPNLKVLLGDMELDRNNLLIDKWLLDRNEDLFTERQGHSHGGDTTGDGSHNHQLKHGLQDKLSIGDKVIMVRDNNKFIIINKVVSI